MNIWEGGDTKRMQHELLKMPADCGGGEDSWMRCGGGEDRLDEVSDALCSQHAVEMSRFFNH